MTKHKFALSIAKSQAEQILAALAPACERIAIAGSIRRQVEQVGDIELVAIPRFDEEHDLFDRVFARKSQLDQALTMLVEGGRLRVGDKQGERYKTFLLPTNGLQLDLFICSPDRWGMIYTIRTGSADFSKWMVTSQHLGGALPLGWRVSDGYLWRWEQNNGAVVIPTPEEQNVFDALGLAWIEPSQRVIGRWRKG